MNERKIEKWKERRKGLIKEEGKKGMNKERIK
jgi:hypothetical protein